jgi:hypothetical protein
MNQGVVYLNLGTRLMARLLVSLYSLRKHYGGRVCVISGQDEASIWAAGKILEVAGNLDIMVVKGQFERLAENTAYVAKTRLHRFTPFDGNVLIDADTLVVGSIDELFPERDEVVLTRFSNWSSNGQTISGRLVRVLHADELVAEQLRSPYPAINTGVIGFRRYTRPVEEWERLTALNPSTHLADEVVMQVLYSTFEHRVLDDRFNLSPLHGCHFQEPRIWHFHGDRHLLPESAKVWLPAFREVWDANLAGIQGWAPGGDARLAEHLAKAEARGEGRPPTHRDR